MANTMRILLWLLPLSILVVVAIRYAERDRAVTVNEMRFSLDGVGVIAISYNEETLTFHRGEGEQLVVMEYMNRDRRSYRAKVAEGGGRIQISEGRKPLLRAGFHRRVEVYLPAGYTGALAAATTSGEMDLGGVEVALAAFRADTTSGQITIGAVAADSIRLTTTSGEIRCGALTGEVCLETTSGAVSVDSAVSGGEFRAHTTSGSYRLETVTADLVEIKTTSGDVQCGELSGRIDYATTSGDLSIRSAVGSGRFDASNSGEIAVAFSDLTGDVSLTNKNGGITLVLPAGLSFRFEGSARNGSINTSFDNRLQWDGDALRGDVGGAPALTVRVETREGDIAVTQ